MPAPPLISHFEVIMLKKPYCYGAYSKFDDKEQWIRNQCPFCYEPKEFKVFPIPEIVRNDVKIIDMNLLSKPEALNIIQELGRIKVNKKVVRYQLVCGIDYRFLTDQIAEALRKSRFEHIRIAWDWGYDRQLKIKDAIENLIGTGYRAKDIMIFMICNWKIPLSENCLKLDICKIWGVKVADCYFDGQTMPNVKPIHWTQEEIKQFRAKVRKHNQLVNFRCDPELKKGRYGNKQLTEF